MSEFDALNFCPKCGKKTMHTFSGSGRSGACSECGQENPKQEEV